MFRWRLANKSILYNMKIYIITVQTNKRETTNPDSQYLDINGIDTDHTDVNTFTMSFIR